MGKEEVTVVVVGMRNSGTTTVAKLIYASLKEMGIETEVQCKTTLESRKMSETRPTQAYESSKYIVDKTKVKLIAD